MFCIVIFLKNEAYEGWSSYVRVNNVNWTFYVVSFWWQQHIILESGFGSGGCWHYWREGMWYLQGKAGWNMASHGNGKGKRRQGICWSEWELRVSRMALFRASSERCADVSLTIICKQPLRKPGNQWTCMVFVRTENSLSLKWFCSPGDLILWCVPAPHQCSNRSVYYANQHSAELAGWV